ncbi:diguanylate cyclase domain-containing protein [Litchfieldia alkalitelluris]|uniref:diguanylate cyclase domain-containing protein n=1 Tax=Litchfieldia alkalitelluris TaxID=304268 RepID=UPI000997813A|nr:diguanylate cyclase [Litchfieldia alkalitelluris]
MNQILQNKYAFLIILLILGVLSNLLDELVHRAFTIPNNIWYEIIDVTVMVSVTAPLLYWMINKIRLDSNQIQQAKDELQQIFDTSNANFYSLDLENKKVKVSQGIEKLYGYSKNDFLNNPELWKQVIHPEDKRYVEGFEVCLSTQELKAKTQEYRIVRPDGEIKWVEEHVTPLFNSLGQVVRLNFIMLDITDRKKVEQELNQKREELKISEQNYKTVVDISPIMIVIHQEGKIVYANPKASQIAGIKEPSNLIGTSIYDLIDPSSINTFENMFQDLQEGKLKSKFAEYKLVRPDGDTLIFEMLGTNIFYNGKPAILSVGRDITDQKKMETALRQLAYHDELTQLPNRRFLYENLKKSIARSERHNHKFALLFLDLDGFKKVNDTKGHDVGDLLLIEVSRRLTQCVRDEDVVSRVGGDEFVIILEEILENEVHEVSKRIIKEVSTPYSINDSTVHVTTSIGISIYPHNGKNEEDLINAADKAMYFAKNKGKNNYKIYDPEIENSINSKFEFFEKIINHFRND